MQEFRTALAGRMTAAILASTLALGPSQAQELPTDQQLQTAFGSIYNHLA